MYSFLNIRKGIAAILMIGMLAACNDNEYVSDKVSDGLISGQLLVKAGQQKKVVKILILPGK